MSKSDHLIPGFTIRRYADIANAPGLQSALDAIFFEGSNTKSFANDEARRAFRERWLGRYLTHDPEWVYVALLPDERVAGYLAGSLSDPAATPRFADIPYFTQFKTLTRTFPAHLHVNLAGGLRSQGMGSALVQCFVSDVAKAGAPGVHAVTSEQSRNRSFYARNGFAVEATLNRNSPAIVFLARAL